MIRGACVALATFLLVTAARAEPSTSEARAMAETLFFTGRGLMEAGRYAEACQKFAESYRLDPAAGTLLNLAVCHEKEGKIASAWGEFKQALSDAKKADRPDREELAAEHIAAIEPELPFLAINVPPDARVIGLEVVRNGSPLLSGSWGTELPVDPGPVEIVVRAPGYVAQSRKLTIERKQHLTVTIDPLTPLPKVAPPPPPVVSDTGWSARRPGRILRSARRIRQIQERRPVSGVRRRAQVLGGGRRADGRRAAQRMDLEHRDRPGRGDDRRRNVPVRHRRAQQARRPRDLRRAQRDRRRAQRLLPVTDYGRSTRLLNM